MPTPVINPPESIPSIRLISEEPAPAMRQRLRAMLQQYSTDKAAFTTLNPTLFSPDFATSATYYLQQAENAAPHDARVAAGEVATDAVDAAMATARQQAQALYYFVGQAYPGGARKPALLRFGQPAYDNAREDADALGGLLDQALAALADVPTATALAAHGYGAPQLTALTAARAVLRTARTAQGTLESVNAQTGQDYYRAQNRAYWFGQQLRDAADVVYRGQGAKLDQYRLSPPGPEAREFTLKPGQRKAIRLESDLTNPDRLLRFGLRTAAPDPAQPAARVWAALTDHADAKPTTRYALAPTLKGQSAEVAVSQLGKGAWLVLENETPEQVEGRVSVADAANGKLPS